MHAAFKETKLAAERKEDIAREKMLFLMLLLSVTLEFVTGALDLGAMPPQNNGFKHERKSQWCARAF